MIGGWNKFRDYLENFKQLYIPPPNDFNAEFGLAILKKKKKVFKLSEVRFINGIPQESEFKVERLREMIKDDAEIKQYLPDWTEKHVPDKRYLYNIVNTVHKNSIVNWIRTVKTTKTDEKQKQHNDFLLIDSQTLKELESFHSIYDADTDKKNRLAGLLMESRKKEKKSRKKRFVLDYQT